MKKLFVVMTLLMSGICFAQAKAPVKTKTKVQEKAGLIAKATPHQTTLTWVNSTTTTVTGYYVYKGTTPGGESATALNSAPVQSGYVDTNVTPLQTVYYTVKAFDPTSTAPGLSIASPEVPATTPGNGAPNPPTGVTGSAT